MKFIKKLFKKTFKIVTSKTVRYFLLLFSIIILLLWVIINIYKTSIIAVQETIKTVDYLIVEEQKRDLKRFEEKITIANEHINELQGQLKDVKVGPRVKLSEDKKRELLRISWELKKDSLRIENALANHQNDWSVNLYPRKDESIQEKFKEYWGTHILIDRLIEGIERIAYATQGVDKFQLQKLQEDLKEVKKMTDQQN